MFVPGLELSGGIFSDYLFVYLQADELFDDLEAEFTLEKPKVKKFNEVPFGGGPGGGGAGGLKSTGLGGGKKGHNDDVSELCLCLCINCAFIIIV